MKVVHVIWDLGLGGAQTYLVQLLHNLVTDEELELEVIVLARRDSVSDWHDRLNVPVSYFGMRSGLDWVRFISFSKKILIDRPDLIHSHCHNILFNILLNVLKIPVVYTEHGGGLLSGRLRDKWIYRYLYRPIQAFIAISETMAGVMKSTNPDIAELVVTVPNGVELGLIDSQSACQEWEWPEKVRGINKRVGIVGRLVEEKGIDLFLDVAAELLKYRENVAFIIIGDGPLKPLLEARAEDLGISEKVLFLGYRVDVVRWLKGLDVYLFTSKIEGFGMVLVEAMAAGVPVVAAHIKGAVPEIIENYVNGVFVEGGDPGELARNVCMLLDQPDLASSLAKKARSIVESRYTMSANAQSIAAIYKEIAVR